MLKKLFWPFLFVLIWSTGPAATKQSIIDASPMMIMFGRYLIAFLILVPILILLPSRRLPTGMNLVHSAVSGLFLHFLFVGAVFWSVAGGVSAILAGVLNGMQPIIVMILGFLFLNEKVTTRKIIGMALSFIGLIIFVMTKEGAQVDTPLSMVFLYFFGVVALSIGMVYQKKFCENIAIIENTCVQFFATTVAFAVMLVLVGDYRLNITNKFIISFTCLTLIISVTAILILAHLIKTNQISNVSMLFYLTPLVSAGFSFLVFAETMNIYQMFAMGLVILGIIFVMLEFRPKNTLN